MEIRALNQLLGNIDIYLLDQLLKERFDKEMLILDAGCGEGRNTHYFIRSGYQIMGVDSNPVAIQMARITAKTLDPTFDPLRFLVAAVENLPFHKGAFDVLISSAVMHFANDLEHFNAMLEEQMRVLKEGGLFGYGPAPMREVVFPWIQRMRITPKPYRMVPKGLSLLSL